MLHSFGGSKNVSHNLTVRWRKERLLKSLPYVVDGLLCGVYHIFGIKAVVAQFVHKNLVGREIGDFLRVLQIVYC